MPTAGIYISAADYETFGKFLPSGCKTVTQFASQELHRIAEQMRKRSEFQQATETKEGTPIIPMYDRQ